MVSKLGFTIPFCEHHNRTENENKKEKRDKVIAFNLRSDKVIVLGFAF